MKIEINRRTSFKEFEEKINNNRELLIAFNPISLYEQETINRLQLRFSNLAITGVKWNGTVIIREGITNKEILTNKNEFLRFFKEYTNKGLKLLDKFFFNMKIERGENEINSLMKKLRQDDNYPIFEIQNNWKCRIHGGDFGFENLETNQLIEVSMGDYMKLNTWSLAQYLSYSDDFEMLNILTQAKTYNIRKAMDILFLNGYLEEANDKINNELKLKIDFSYT